MVNQSYIGSTIQNNWECSSWINTSTEGIQHQFCDGNPNPTNSLIANSKNLSYCKNTSRSNSVAAHLFAITNDNQIDIFVRSPSFQIPRYAIRIVNVQITAFWSSEQPGVLCNCVSLCWGVYNRKRLLDVVQDELKIVNFKQAAIYSPERLAFRTR
jgi:hypothetical protein